MKLFTKYPITMKLWILSFILLIAMNLHAQKSDQGKLRVIYKDFHVSSLSDSCKMFILNGEKIIYSLDIKKYLQTQSQSKTTFLDEIFTSGDYYAIIENLFNKPLLITNISINKKLITFLPLDYTKLEENSIDLNSFYVRDAKLLMEDYSSDSGQTLK